MTFEPNIRPMRKPFSQQMPWPSFSAGAKKNITPLGEKLASLDQQLPKTKATPVTLRPSPQTRINKKVCFSSACTIIRHSGMHPQSHGRWSRAGCSCCQAL